MFPQTLWTKQHTDFVKGTAARGKDARTIFVLFQAEFPNVKGLTLGLVKSVLKEGAAASGSGSGSRS